MYTTGGNCRSTLPPKTKPPFGVNIFKPHYLKTRKNAIDEYLDYQIPVTQQMGPKGNEDIQAAKRD